MIVLYGGLAASDQTAPGKAPLRRRWWCALCGSWIAAGSTGWRYWGSRARVHDECARGDAYTHLAMWGDGA